MNIRTLAHTTATALCVAGTIPSTIARAQALPTATEIVVHTFPDTKGQAYGPFINNDGTLTTYTAGTKKIERFWITPGGVEKLSDSASLQGPDGSLPGPDKKTGDNDVNEFYDELAGTGNGGIVDVKTLGISYDPSAAYQDTISFLDAQTGTAKIIAHTEALVNHSANEDYAPPAWGEPVVKDGKIYIDTYTNPEGGYASSTGIASLTLLSDGTWQYAKVIDLSNAVKSPSISIATVAGYDVYGFKTTPTKKGVKESLIVAKPNASGSYEVQDVINPLATIVYNGPSDSYYTSMITEPYTQILFTDFNTATYNAKNPDVERGAFAHLETHKLSHLTNYKYFLGDTEVYKSPQGHCVLVVGAYKDNYSQTGLDLYVQDGPTLKPVASALDYSFADYSYGAPVVTDDCRIMRMQSSFTASGGWTNSLVETSINGSAPAAQTKPARPLPAGFEPRMVAHMHTLYMRKGNKQMEPALALGQ